MKSKDASKTFFKKVIIKKCHVCGQVIESTTEIKKCPSCQKHFLPLNYFRKIQHEKQKDYEALFSASDELVDEDLIKGLYVLW